MDTYKSKKETLKQLGISSMTLLKMADQNQIEYMKTIGGHRKYNVIKYIEDNKIINKTKEKTNIKDNKKLNICYVRVSTMSQKDDLVRSLYIFYFSKMYTNMRIARIYLLFHKKK